MKNNELMEHYDFYLDNCTDDEIPIIFGLFKSEYTSDLYDILNEVTA